MRPRFFLMSVTRTLRRLAGSRNSGSQLYITMAAGTGRAKRAGAGAINRPNGIRRVFLLAARFTEVRGPRPERQGRLGGEGGLDHLLARPPTGSVHGLLRTNFIFQRPGSDKVIGEFRRKMTILDRYVLDLTADRTRAFDRRIAVALGVMLDTGERR